MGALMPFSKEKIVGTWFGLFAMCLAAGITLILGLALSVEYESTCTTNEAGKTNCNTRSAWKGWSGLPVEAIAGLGGTISAAAAAYGFAQKRKDEQQEGEK